MKKFGKLPPLDIHSPAEAVRALCSMIRGFEDELRKGQYRVVKAYSDGRERDYTAANLHFALGGADILRIEPVARGRKQGLLNIVLGVVLVGAAFLLTGGALSATAISVAGMSVTGTQMALVGGLLALSGISSMLMPTMEQGTDENKDKSSAMINAPNNKTEPGHPVPLVYGRRVFTGSVVIANSVSAEEFDDGE